MRHRGTITNWKHEQGYGFIVPENGGAHVFAHIKAFSNRQLQPCDGETVTYELAKDQHGRMRAEKVRVDGDVLDSSASPSSGITAVAYTVLFLTVVTGTTLAGILPLFIPGIYLGASKSEAKRS